MVLPVGVLGFYVNYAHAYMGILAAGTGAEAGPFPHFGVATVILGAGYLLPFAAVMMPKPRKTLFRGPAGPWVDATLCLSSVLFAVFTYTQWAARLGTAHFAQGVALGAVLAAAGVAAWEELPRGLALHRVLPILASGCLALATFKVQDPVLRLWAWTGGSLLWTALGMIAAQPYFRVAGFLLALVMPFLYWTCRGGLGPDRLAALSRPLAAYSAAAYLLGWWRGYVPAATARSWERRGEELWFALATVYLGFALWTRLEPPAFAVAMAGAVLAIELLSVRLDRPALWAQAGWLGPAVGVYTFFIDYGANLALLGPLTPRKVTSLAVAGVLAYLRYADPVPQGFAPEHPRGKQRLLLGWLAAGVVAFMAYHEPIFGPRMRMPVHSALAVAAYLFGRAWLDRDLRKQGYVLSLLAAAEGLLHYAFVPKAMLEDLTTAGTALYWLSALALLAPVAFPPPEEDRDPEDRRAGALFCAVSLGLLSAFLYKEGEGYLLTLGWSLLGATWLAAGLVFDKPPLRHPGLALLGLCVLKAFFHDMAGLDLPYRVASFLVLGAALMGVSYLYVSHRKKGPSG